MSDHDRDDDRRFEELNEMMEQMMLKIDDLKAAVTDLVAADSDLVAALKDGDAKAKADQAEIDSLVAQVKAATDAAKAANPKPAPAPSPVPAPASDFTQGHNADGTPMVGADGKPVDQAGHPEPSDAPAPAPFVQGHNADGSPMVGADGHPLGLDAGRVDGDAAAVGQEHVPLLHREEDHVDRVLIDHPLGLGQEKCTFGHDFKTKEMGFSTF